MPRLITILLLILTKYSFSQDSADFAKLVGKKVPDIILSDTSGNLVKLSSFKGKVIYLDFWNTDCAPCIKLFPHEDSLANRISKLGLDTSIVIINICHDSDVSAWKNLIRGHHSAVVNLHLKGKKYALKRKLGFIPYPTYYIIGKDFSFLGADVMIPSNKLVDYCLYRATNNIPYVDALREIQRFQEMTDPPAWYQEWRSKLEGTKR